MTTIISFLIISSSIYSSTIDILVVESAGRIMNPVASLYVRLNRQLIINIEVEIYFQLLDRLNPILRVNICLQLLQLAE